MTLKHKRILVYTGAGLGVVAVATVPTVVALSITRQNHQNQSINEGQKEEQKQTIDEVELATKFLQIFQKIQDDPAIGKMLTPLFSSVKKYLFDSGAISQFLLEYLQDLQRKEVEYQKWLRNYQIIKNTLDVTNFLIQKLQTNLDEIFETVALISTIAFIHVDNIIDNLFDKIYLWQDLSSNSMKDVIGEITEFGQELMQDWQIIETKIDQVVNNFIEGLADFAQGFKEEFNQLTINQFIIEPLKQKIHHIKTFFAPLHEIKVVINRNFNQQTWAKLINDLNNKHYKVVVGKYAGVAVEILGILRNFAENVDQSFNTNTEEQLRDITQELLTIVTSLSDNKTVDKTKIVSQLQQLKNTTLHGVFNKFTNWAQNNINDGIYGWISNFINNQVKPILNNIENSEEINILSQVGLTIINHEMIQPILKIINEQKKLEHPDWKTTFANIQEIIRQSFDKLKKFDLKTQLRSTFFPPSTKQANITTNLLQIY